MQATDNYDPTAADNKLWADKNINSVLTRYVPTDAITKDPATYTGQEKHDCDDMNNFADIIDYVYSCIFDVTDSNFVLTNGYNPDFKTLNLPKEPASAGTTEWDQCWVEGNSEARRCF